jgi:short-subunit dehydrogenase
MDSYGARVIPGQTTAVATCMELNGLTALVTGANRGIGRALTEALAREPLDLLLAGARDPEAMEPVIAPPGGAREVRATAIDLSSRETIERSVAGLPDVDLLVNNAGRFAGGLLEDQDLDDVYGLFQVNLVAVTQLTRALLPAMLRRGRGKIVNNASIAGYADFPAATTYSASKAGVLAFGNALRRELKDTGVSVLTLVTPGVDTDMMDATLAVYRQHMSTTGWDIQAPEEWADKVVQAIRSDARELGPGGRTALAKLASRGPAVVLDTVLGRAFKR